MSATAVSFSSDNVPLCPFSLVVPVEPSLSCGERFILPMAQPRGKSDLCEQQDEGEGRQWGARLSPIIPPQVDANPAWLLLESAHCLGNWLLSSFS